MGLGPKVFVRKNGSQKGGNLYKWSPGSSSKKKAKPSTGGRSYFCVSPLNTQGNDFKTTYSYVVVLIKGIAERHAYVQCDYVK